jgi:hypothetical protein
MIIYQNHSLLIGGNFDTANNYPGKIGSLPSHSLHLIVNNIAMLSLLEPTSTWVGVGGSGLRSSDPGVPPYVNALAYDSKSNTLFAGA